jgi:hypothetical protein
VLARRFAAATVDAIYALGLICTGQLVAYFFFRDVLVADPSGAAWWRAALAVVVWLAELVLCAWLTTPGKQVRGLQVVSLRHERAGRGVGPVAAFERSLTRTVPLCAAYAVGHAGWFAAVVAVSGFVAVMSPSRRAGWDLLAGTEVVDLDASLPTLSQPAGSTSTSDDLADRPVPDPTD